MCNCDNACVRLALCGLIVVMLFASVTVHEKVLFSFNQDCTIHPMMYYL